MAQQFYTEDNVNLTRDRELSILEHALGDGIYEGLVAQKGSNPWSVDFFQGLASIKGALFYLDQDLQDYFDLGSPSNNQDRHFQFWIAYWPGDEANDPFEQAIQDIENNTSYQTHKTYTSGEVHIDYFEADYNQPSDRVDVIDIFEQYSQEAAQHILIPIDIFCPGSASDLTDARFAPASIQRLDDLWSYTETSYDLNAHALTFSEVSADDTIRVKWRDLRGHALSARKDVSQWDAGRGTELRFQGSPTSGGEEDPHGYTDKLDIDIDGNTDLIFVFARTLDSSSPSQDNFFRENASDEQVYALPLKSDNMTATGSTVTDAIYEKLQGSSESYNDIDHWPNRPELQGVIPIAIIRRYDYSGSTLFASERWVAFWANGTTSVDGDHILRGINSGYVSALYSGVGPYQYKEPDDKGVIALEDVITNLDRLHDLGLDIAYDSALPGDDGSGRTIDVDSQAVQLNNYPGQDLQNPNDPWVSTLRFEMHNNTSGANWGREEAALDVESPHENNTSLRHRTPLSRQQWGGKLEGLTCRLEYDSNNDRVYLLPNTPNGNDLTASKWRSEFRREYDKHSRFLVSFDFSNASSYDNGAGSLFYYLVIPEDTNTYPDLWIEPFHSGSVKNDFNNLSDGSPIEDSDGVKTTIWLPMVSLGLKSHFFNTHHWGAASLEGDVFFDSDNAQTVQFNDAQLRGDGGDAILKNWSYELKDSTLVLDNSDIDTQAQVNVTGGGMEFQAKTWFNANIEFLNNPIIKGDVDVYSEMDFFSRLRLEKSNSSKSVDLLFDAGDADGPAWQTVERISGEHVFFFRHNTKDTVLKPDKTETLKSKSKKFRYTSGNNKSVYVPITWRDADDNEQKLEAPGIDGSEMQEAVDVPTPSVLKRFDYNYDSNGNSSDSFTIDIFRSYVDHAQLTVEKTKIGSVQINLNGSTGSGYISFNSLNLDESDGPLIVRIQGSVSNLAVTLKNCYFSIESYTPSAY
ncbi:MAG: hypothetical protein ABEN55_02515 [Bradymonadaceae bacterium]